MGHVNTGFSPNDSEADATPQLVSELPSFKAIREHYPHIADAIEHMWGSKEMDAYFNHVVVKDREQRAGFPPVVMAAILSLSALHVHRFQFEPFDSYDDIWDPFVKHAHRH